MPKIDAQKRLTVPLELRTRSSTFNKKNSIAIYYEDDKIFLTSSSNEKISEKAVLSIREIDEKGRFFLSNDMLELLDSKIGDTLFVSLYEKDDIICIFKK